MRKTLLCLSTLLTLTVGKTSAAEYAFETALLGASLPAAGILPHLALLK